MRIAELRGLALAVNLITISACAHSADGDALLGKWANRRVSAKRPAIVAIEFLPKSTMTARRRLARFLLLVGTGERR